MSSSPIGPQPTTAAVPPNGRGPRCFICFINCGFKIGFPVRSHFQPIGIATIVVEYAHVEIGVSLGFKNLRRQIHCLDSILKSVFVSWLRHHGYRSVCHCTSPKDWSAISCPFTQSKIVFLNRPRTLPL